MKFSLLVLFLVLFSTSVHGDNDCEVEEPDNHVYSFAYGINGAPFMDVNEDDELFGFSYNVIREICKVMKKTCVHIVHYDYSLCWGASYMSTGLNNGWWDVCVGYMQTSVRKSVYGFVATISEEPISHVYVRKDSTMMSLGDVNQEADYIGFVDRWWTDHVCLEKKTNINVGGKAKDHYKSVAELKEALVNGEVDAVFAPDDQLRNDDRVKRLSTSAIRCAHAGTSMMMRKDMVDKLKWMDEGLKKIQQNGVYDWFCNIAEKDGDPRCLND